MKIRSRNVSFINLKVTMVEFKYSLDRGVDKVGAGGGGLYQENVTT